MDDLESFFYVLYHVAVSYNGGRPMQPAVNHPALKGWSLPRDQAATAKGFFMLRPRLPRVTSSFNDGPYTADQFFAPLDSLRAVFLPNFRSYDDAVESPSSVSMHSFVSWEDYTKSAEEAYDKFLRSVNEVIDALEATYVDRYSVKNLIALVVYVSFQGASNRNAVKNDL